MFTKLFISAVLNLNLKSVFQANDIQKLSSYLKQKLLSLHYNDQSVYGVSRNYHWESHDHIKPTTCPIAKIQNFWILHQVVHTTGIINFSFNQVTDNFCHQVSRWLVWIHLHLPKSIQLKFVPSYGTANKMFPNICHNTYGNTWLPKTLGFTITV